MTNIAGFNFRSPKFSLRLKTLAGVLLLAGVAYAAPVVVQKGSLASYVYIPAAAPVTAPGGGGGPVDSSQLNTCYLDFPQTYPDITHAYPRGAEQTSVVLHYTVVGGGGGSGGANLLRPTAGGAFSVQLGTSGKSGSRATGSFTFSAGDVLRLLVGGGGGAAGHSGFQSAATPSIGVGGGGSGGAGYYGGGGGGGTEYWAKYSDGQQPFSNRAPGGGGGGSSAILKNGTQIAVGAGGDGGDGANWPDSGGKGGSNVGGAGAFNGATSTFVANGNRGSKGGSAGSLGNGGFGGGYGPSSAYVVGLPGSGVGRAVGAVYDSYWHFNSINVNASVSGGGGGLGSAGGSVFANVATTYGIAHGGHITGGLIVPPGMSFGSGTHLNQMGYPVLLEENSRYITQFLGRSRTNRYGTGSPNYDELMHSEAFFKNSLIVNGSAPWAGMGGELLSSGYVYHPSQQSTSNATKSFLSIGPANANTFGFGGSSGAIMLSYQAKTCFL